MNAIASDFGATTFGADGDSGLKRVTDHATTVDPDVGAGYLDRGTGSLRNVAVATAGRDDDLSPHVPKNLTLVQETLLESMLNGSYGY